jgi:hypothetical protein
MDVQLDVAKILEATQARLAAVTNENIMLQCLVLQQQEENQQLRAKIDQVGEEIQNAEEK